MGALHPHLTAPRASVLGLILTVLLCGAACGGDADPTAEQTTTERATDIDGLGEPLGEGLPEEITGFAGWLRLNATPIPPKSADPHLGEKNVFYNGDASEAEAVDEGNATYPAGSIIVKTATRPESDFVGLVAIMRKVAGADPEHNDWEFVEYTRDSPDTSFEIIAQDAICWTCHTDASPTDFVFTRRG